MKAKVTSMRNDQTDTKGKGDVAIAVNWGAETVADQSRNRGDKVNKPVGNVTNPNDRFDSVGGRGSTDTESAKRLGTQGKKR